MRVAIIDLVKAEITSRGESDLKMVDGLYTRVDNDGSTDKSAAMQLTMAAYVFPEVDADTICDELRPLVQAKKAAEDALAKKQYAIMNHRRARP